jgi:uncharacterized protein YcnI
MEMSSERMRRLCVLLVTTWAALVLADAASAHAQMSPPLVLAKEGQVFTLAVPTEEEDASTTRIELTPPAGFSIDSFSPAPGWTRSVRSTGSGEETRIRRVTWSGGNVPHEEAATFQFLGSTEAAKRYSFEVRQFYSDGSVVDWSGPESSDTPAPAVEARTSLGGGGGDRTIAIVALVLAGLAAVVSVAALVTRSGRRTLT